MPATLSGTPSISAQRDLLNGDRAHSGSGRWHGPEDDRQTSALAERLLWCLTERMHFGMHVLLICWNKGFH